MDGELTMTLEQERRLEMLRSGPCVPLGYIRDYYGLDWPLSGAAAAAFEQYRKTLRRREPCPADRLSRYELEGFMARAEAVTRKWMGARLGMDEASLDALLSRLEAFGMQRGRYEIGNAFVAESLPEDLARYVPGLRFRTFRDHTAFCERLHAELTNSVDLRIKGLFCATSERLREPRRRYAAYFDCLTLEPLSTEHSVWLDFQKPLNLPPDRCSKLFYVENREALRPSSAGTAEPDNLDEYEQFLAGSRHV
jgi:hypothetical protein